MRKPYIVKDKRPSLVYCLCRLILQVLRFGMFGMRKNEKIRLPAGPCLILANHCSFFDPLIVLSVTPQQIGFVAGDHLFRYRFIKWFLSEKFGSVSCEKGSNHMKAVMDIKRIIQEGGKLCMFGDGNITYDGATEPMDVSTGKLARMLKCPVVTVRIEGSYALRPRWSTLFHRGKVRCERVGVYYPEQLQKMTPQETIDMFNRDLYVEEPQRDENEKKAFMGKSKGLQYVLYSCPVCGSFKTIVPDGRSGIKCVKCGAAGEWTRYGIIDSTDFPYKTLYEWNRWQKEHVREIVSKYDKMYATNPGARLIELTQDHKEVTVTEGNLSLSGTELSVGEYSFKIRDIMQFDTRDKGIILFTTYSGKYYEIRSENGYPGLLYKEIFNDLKKQSASKRSVSEFSNQEETSIG